MSVFCNIYQRNAEKFDLKEDKLQRKWGEISSLSNDLQYEYDVQYIDQHHFRHFKIIKLIKLSAENVNK